MPAEPSEKELQLQALVEQRAEAEAFLKQAEEAQQLAHVKMREAKEVIWKQQQEVSKLKQQIALETPTVGLVRKVTGGRVYLKISTSL